MKLEKTLEENKFIVVGGILVITAILLIIAALTYPEGGVGIISP